MSKCKATCVIKKMSSARYCVGCGKKYYPKSYYSYPEIYYGVEEDRDEQCQEYARFHSLTCMKSWLSDNRVAFANLVDNITECDIRNKTIEKG